LEAKGSLVTFEVFSVPFRKGDGLDGSGDCLTETLAEAEAEAEAVVAAATVDSPDALKASAASCVVPGVTTLSAAEASNATTPRSTDDATRSVNN
jgi:hypothetical protein